MNNEYIELKFKLGSQLENWEFDLSTLREYIQDGINYEVYEYVGSDKSFLGIESDKIELTFNADILVKVEYYFNGNHIKYFEGLFFAPGNFLDVFVKIDFNKPENVTVLSYLYN